MNVYIIYFIFILIGALLSNNKMKNSFYLVSLLLLWLIIGLRDISIGVDTYDYVHDFMYAKQRSCNQFLQNSNEPLYSLLTWVVAHLFDGYAAYLLMWASFPIFSIYMICKSELKESLDILLSIITIFILGFYAFYIAGIRQSAAMSVCLFGWRFLKKNKLLPFLCVIFIAFLFHNSALLFLFAYPLRFFKVRWYYIIFVLLFSFVSSIIHIDFIVNISQFLFADRFGAYGTTYESELSMSGFIMHVLLFSICFLKYNDLIQRDSNNNILFMLCLISLFFQAMTGILAEMARVSMYFGIFFIILLPRAIKCFQPKTRRLVIVSIVILSIVYLFFLSSANMPFYVSSMRLL